MTSLVFIFFPYVKKIQDLKLKERLPFIGIIGKGAVNCSGDFGGWRSEKG
jgi:hypothetical protein